jgi:hypothetical protein
MVVILSKKFWHFLLADNPHIAKNEIVNFLTVFIGLNFEKVVDPNLLGNSQSGIALRMKLIIQYCFKLSQSSFRNGKSWKFEVKFR